MRYSDRVDRIAGEGAAAWEIHFAAMEARRAGVDVIVMSVGDPEFDTPPPIVEAAVKALRGGDTHYAEIVGRRALREAIARDHAIQAGAELAADNVVVLAGAQNALFAASLCLFSSGDEVLVLDPMYLTYEASIEVTGASLVRVSPLPDSGFRPDIPAIERAVTPNTRAILLANPNNPSGVVMNEAELLGIADIARRHDLWVISDEVYAALTFDRPHIPMSGLPGMAERTATVGSLSKSLAMPGFRCGWLIGPEELTRHVGTLALCMLYGQPGFIQEAATLALTEARSEMAAMREGYRRLRDEALASLADLPELRILKPEAGMFVLIDVRGTGLSATDFAWRLFREGNVAVLEATAFGASAAGFVRLSYALEEGKLREAGARIRRFVETLRSERRKAAG